MSEHMYALLEQYAKGLRHIYGSRLKSVILYGSYARGDYTKDSDVDIMILVDQTEYEIMESRNKVSDYTYDFNEEHELLIMPIVKNEAHFNRWLNAYPFYNNIKKEGVELHVS